MLKQSSSKIKKVLAILLAVLFVVSLTVAVASARDGNEGHGHDGGGHGSSITGIDSTRFGSSVGSVYGHSGCGWVNGAWVCST